MEDDIPVSDYGYVAKDGDIWIYTGITSVNGDSSNIGFLLANERTGESRYYVIAGADEKSAIAAIREAVIDGNTYIYLIDKDANIYKGKVAQQESLLLLQAGDTVELTYSGKTILSCRKIEK